MSFAWHAMSTLGDAMEPLQRSSGISTAPTRIRPHSAAEAAPLDEACAQHRAAFERHATMSERLLKHEASIAVPVSPINIHAVLLIGVAGVD